jgi:hypothetical protein
MRNRSRVLRTALLATGFILSPLVHAAGQAIEVLKTSGCGCCIGWVRHLEEAGYAVTSRDLPIGELMKIKRDAGLTLDLTSCHTGLIGVYVIEGHVPAREIDRLLQEQPDAIGLAVPNMPLGSPGMDFGEAEPYQVLLVRRDGSTEMYAAYP